MKDQEIIRITNVEKRRAEMEVLKAEIQELLNISHFEYCMFQFEQGLIYLKAYTTKDVHPLYTSRVFWAWWRNQWSDRDQEVIKHIADGEGMGLNYPLKTKRAIYEANNQGDYLITDNYPNKVVMEESYINMLKGFTNDQIGRNPGQYAPKAGI